MLLVPGNASMKRKSDVCTPDCHAAAQRRQEKTMRRSLNATLSIAALAVFLMFAVESQAYDTYTGGCDNCHGGFRDGTSTKGSVFPSDDKHEMHRSSSEMDADCNLCHTQIGDDPFIGSSAGTANNTGYGCVGCHGRLEDAGNDGISAGLGAGLRQHHNNTGITECAICHTDANPINYTPVGEHVKPPYFGTADTNADMSCNPILAGRTNENWTLTDFVGLDNDGDVFYDAVGDADCMPPNPTAGDLDFDGKADIVWRNLSTGRVDYWQMNGATITMPSLIAGVGDLNWQIIGNGDYTGDSKADILWRNTVSGRVDMWQMNGPAITTNSVVAGVGDLNWQVIGNGDYNGDGMADVLWRNMASSRIDYWQMNGTTITSSTVVAGVAGLDWQVIGSGDYNGDGMDDILWRNAVSGRVDYWQMNGATKISDAVVAGVGDLNWQIMGSGDYNGDGMADILWRNSVSGRVDMWLMNGPAITTNSIVAGVGDLNWQIIGNYDHNGDGMDDILWRNVVTGRVDMWQMNGPTITTPSLVAGVGDLNWQVVNVD